MFSHEDEDISRDPDRGQDRANDRKREKLEIPSYKYSEVWRQPLLLGKQKYFQITCPFHSFPCDITVGLLMTRLPLLISHQGLAATHAEGNLSS